MSTSDEIMHEESNEVVVIENGDENREEEKKDISEERIQLIIACTMKREQAGMIPCKIIKIERMLVSLGAAMVNCLIPQKVILILLSKY